MARPEITLPKGAMYGINERVTKAIQYIAQKNNLDDGDIQAIETLLRICSWCNNTANSVTRR